MYLQLFHEYSYNAIQMTPNLIATRESKCQEVFFLYKIGVCERYIITLKSWHTYTKKELQKEIIIM